MMYGHLLKPTASLYLAVHIIIITFWGREESAKSIRVIQSLGMGGTYF